MKSLIETYGRFLIVFICMMGFFSLFRYAVNKSTTTVQTYTNSTIDANATGDNSGNILLTTSKSPIIEISDSYKTKYIVEENSYITRDDLLQNVTAYTSASKENILSIDNITISVYEEKIEEDENGNVIYEYKPVKNKYGNYLRNSSGDIANQNVPVVNSTYLGFIPTNTEKNKYQNETNEEKQERELLWEKQNIQRLANDGICKTYPGKYKIVYRIENNGLKNEVIRYINVEYDI